MRVTNENVEEILLYRQAMEIVEVRVYRNGSSFAVCPRCGKVVEMQLQAYCGSCGQKLKWGKYRNAKLKYV